MRYGHQEAFVELWLVQSRDHSSGRGTSGGTTKSKRSSNTMNGSDESLEEVGRTVSPKEEGQSLHMYMYSSHAEMQSCISTYVCTYVHTCTYIRTYTYICNLHNNCIKGSTCV